MNPAVFRLACSTQIPASDVLEQDAYLKEAVVTGKAMGYFGPQLKFHTEIIAVEFTGEDDIRAGFHRDQHFDSDSPRAHIEQLGWKDARLPGPITADDSETLNPANPITGLASPLSLDNPHARLRIWRLCSFLGTPNQQDARIVQPGPRFTAINLPIVTTCIFIGLLLSGHGLCVILNVVIGGLAASGDPSLLALQ